MRWLSESFLKSKDSTRLGIHVRMDLANWRGNLKIETV